MISPKIRKRLYMASTATIVLPVIVYIFLVLLGFKSFGTGGQDSVGLRLQVQLQQQPVIQQIKIKELDDKDDIKDKAELSARKKKQVKKKKQKTIQPKKQIIDRGRIGRETLQYALRINGIIQRNMIAPDDLDKTYIVKLRFRLNGNGDIILLNVKKSSGNKEIDKLALQTLRSINSFPAPPPIVRRGDMTFVIPLEYKLD